jgi:hypothetical protein
MQAGSAPFWRRLTQVGAKIAATEPARLSVNERRHTVGSLIGDRRSPRSRPIWPPCERGQQVRPKVPSEEDEQGGYPPSAVAGVPFPHVCVQAENDPYSMLKGRTMRKKSAGYHRVPSLRAARRRGSRTWNHISSASPLLLTTPPSSLSIWNDPSPPLGAGSSRPPGDRTIGGKGRRAIFFSWPMSILDLEPVNPTPIVPLAESRSSRRGGPGGQVLQPHFFSDDVECVNPTPIVPLAESRSKPAGGSSLSRLNVATTSQPRCRPRARITCLDRPKDATCAMVKRASLSFSAELW